MIDTALPTFIRPSNPKPHRSVSFSPLIYPAHWVHWDRPSCPEQPVGPGGVPVSQTQLHPPSSIWGSWTIKICRSGTTQPKYTHQRPATPGPLSLTRPPDTYYRKIQRSKTSRWLKAFKRTQSTKVRKIWYLQSTSTKLQQTLDILT